MCGRGGFDSPFSQATTAGPHKRYHLAVERVVKKMHVLDTIMYQGHAHDRVQAQALVRGGMLAGAHPKRRELAAKPPGSHLGTGSEST